MQKLLTLILLLCIGYTSFSQSSKPQELVQKAKTTETKNTLDLFELNQQETKKELQNSSILSINNNNLKSILNKENKFVELSIPLNSNETIDIEAVEVDLGSNYIYTLPEKKKITLNSKHYRGIVKGNNESFVSLSFFNNEVIGLISGYKGQNISISKLKNSTNHIIYNTNEVSTPESYCSTPDDLASIQNNTNNQIEFSSKSALDDKCIKLYIEVDYSLLQLHDSKIEKTTNYVLGIMNQVMTIYGYEGIKTSLSPLNIWTEESPYKDMSTKEALEEFSRRYSETSFDGDAGQLLARTVKSNGAGRAYINTLCSKLNKGVSFYRNTDYKSFLEYSWPVKVVTHEFGHIFGSPHTHACVWNGNNTPIDSCGNNDCDSSGAPIPETGGTIMSYCQNTPVGVNLRFNDQVIKRIKQNIYQKNCLQNCAETPGVTYCDEAYLEVNLLTDRYGNETKWKLTNENGEIVAKGDSYDNNTKYKTRFCIPYGCYKFTIKDAYGDGMCCEHGNGYYEVIMNGKILASGGEFDVIETTEMCVEEQIYPPKPPYDLEIIEQINDTVKISWKKPESYKPISYYKVYLNGKLFSSVNTESATITGLNRDTYNSIDVSAIDVENRSSKRSKHLDVLYEFNYCESKGLDSSYEWLDYFELGSIKNQSGNNNGYEFFKELKTRLFIGQDATLKFKVSLGTYGSSEVFFNGWIDYNQNGIFDIEEQILFGSYPTNTLNTAVIAPPDNAKIGGTRMRIQMVAPFGNYEPSNPCSIYSYGEVEDYFIYINENTNNYVELNEDINNSTSLNVDDVIIAPNPTLNGLTTMYTNHNEGTYSIYTLNGELIQEGSFTGKTKEINLSYFAKGVYILNVKDINNKTIGVKNITVQ